VALKQVILLYEADTRKVGAILYFSTSNAFFCDNSL